MSSQANDDAAQVYVGAAALTISLVALFATVLQLAQQFVLTADGYHRVGENSMGYWGKSRKLRWALKQFRVEVKFETPVIFVCPPSNKRFPAGDRAWFLDNGSRLAIERELRQRWDQQTLTYFVFVGWWRWVFGKRDWWWDNDDDKDTTPSRLLPQFLTGNGRASLIRRRTPSWRSKARVNTTQAELTSWIRLLDGIQDMEEKSSNWQSMVYSGTEFPPSIITTPADLHHAMGERTMTVAIQPYDRSWDTMPTGLIKPYATTTLCHLVEMLAMLSVYWEEFDRSRDRYRAQGNGFIVTGVKVPELGLTFSLNQYGKNRFEENRLIPDDGIKDLCFGKADTIYSAIIDSSRLEPTDIENMTALQLSSPQEIAETLRVLGCNASTVNIFIHGKRTTHLFPVAFELLGMLSRTFHMNNTVFRFIPNPTKYTWDRRSFSIRELLYGYETQLAEHHAKNESPAKARLLQRLHEMQQYLSRLSERSKDPPEPAFLDLLHSAIDEMDEILTAKIKKSKVKGQMITPGGNRLVTETKVQEQRRQTVRDVVKSHIQTVLYVLNRESDEGKTPRMSRRSMSIEYRIPDHMLLPGACVEDIDNAPPEGDHNKQNVLMEIYFQSIRPHTVEQARGTTDQRNRWEKSPRRDFLSASLVNRQVVNNAQGLGGSTPPPPQPPPERKIRRAPTDPTHSSPKMESDGFQPPGPQRTWTLPTNSTTPPRSPSKILAFLGVDAVVRRISPTTSPTEAKPKQSQEQSMLTPAAAEASAPAPTPAPAPRKTVEIAIADDENEKKEEETLVNGKTAEDDDGGAPSESLADLKDVSHDDIWCVLVFRMLCWLALHDFNKKDVQMPPSELVGSRLPVFIA